MAVLSKRLFEQVALNANCINVVHPEYNTCNEARLEIFKSSLKGCFKFYIAIYALQLLLRYKKINKPYLIQSAKDFLRSYVYGLYFTNVFYSTTCLIRYVLGFYHYYSVVLLPGMLGGTAIFLESPIMKNLNSVMFFSMTLEVFLRYLSGENIIKRSVPKDTLCFMIYNSIFLYLLKNNPLSKEACILWFFNPKDKKKSVENIEENKCCENVTCSKHLLQEGLKFFTAGYTFQITRSLVKNVGQIIRTPSTFITNLFSKKALKTGLFFSSYVTIYKVVCRLLQEMEGKEKPNHSLLAGFLAGISYYVYPSVQMNLLPLSMILQILWINIRAKYKIPKWYLKEIFFTICSGILFHSVVLAKEYSPIYVDNMFSSATNGKSRTFIGNVAAYINSKNISFIS